MKKDTLFDSRARGLSSTKFYKGKFSAGFTLIELLIVIAIIGILAAILIPNLLSARAKARDGKIKGTMSGISSQALVYYQSNGTYSGVCATTGTETIGRYVLAAANETAELSEMDYSNDHIATSIPAANVANEDVLCTQTADAWFATVPLNSGGHICVDSSGRTRIKETPSAAVGSGNMTCA